MCFHKGFTQKRAECNKIGIFPSKNMKQIRQLFFAGFSCGVLCPLMATIPHRFICFYVSTYNITVAKRQMTFELGRMIYPRAIWARVYKQWMHTSHTQVQSE